jgi:hypothetical protein
MDSGSERKFAEALDKKKIVWVKNTKTFFIYKNNCGKDCKYFPDFYLPHKNLWVEIKGEYYKTKDDTNKLNAVGNIIMILDREVKTGASLV